VSFVIDERGLTIEMRGLKDGWHLKLDAAKEEF
jgi:hypothetical protein